MTQQDEKAEKVVNLADARKKQRTVQERPARKGGTDGYHVALQQQKKRHGGSQRPMTLGKRLGALVQFIVFLLICYLMLRTCQGQGL